ncbi:PEP-CTERM protein-sorting domain-containing protein [Neorhodopirellula lusitana]|uniref:PEP-CTERM protein-sorting domain-containing protein n=1 Tax=Neorhodopirellula lusitana TaxID=445327 RepID=A0ABY1QTJ5_9BACT|nr:PEP-CTERM sorting domain-containing protein [Neorhodopirellula lusitana]SMP79636.1 PEP-CTERM protein-sorting domain-containing protein [Neorhodopirellula lusitana]
MPCTGAVAYVARPSLPAFRPPPGDGQRYAIETFLIAVCLNMKHSTCLAVLLAFFFAAADSVHADLITNIDQSSQSANIEFFMTTGTGTGFGQSFLPTLSAIDAAEFSLRSAGGVSNVRLDVYDGDGFTGSLLGSSSIVGISNTALETVHFDLDSQISLAIGNAYTLRLLHISGAAYFAEASTLDPYSSGISYNPFGIAVASNDLVFSEGTHVTAVPEPSSFAMLLLGGFGATIIRRHKLSRNCREA